MVQNSNQGGTTTFDLEKLFLPNGKIPSPAWVPKRALYPGSLFVKYSLRVGREVFFTELPEFLFYLMVEFNPNVLWFVEHFPKVVLEIEGKTVYTIYDMLIRYRSLNFALFEIKDKCFNDNNSPQIQRQRIFAETFSVPYKVIKSDLIDQNQILISNLRRLIGYVVWKVDPHINDKILHFIHSQNQVDINDVICYFKHVPETDVYTNIVHLIHSGTIKAPLHKHEFDRNMILSIDGESYESDLPF